MKTSWKVFALAPVLMLLGVSSHASSYGDTITRFKNAGESAAFFHKCYGYAVFPTIGEGAFVVGGAYGKGRVYVHGKLTGYVSVGKVSAGFQAGGKGFSEIIFFEDKRALDEFEASGFEFSADVGVVAITAGASVSANTNGSNAGASATVNNATTRGLYQKGMAVFTIPKGGLMYQASVAGQKFNYTPRGSR